jgi:hypothetical protein
MEKKSLCKSEKYKNTSSLNFVIGTVRRKQLYRPAAKGMEICRFQCK